MKKLSPRAIHAFRKKIYTFYDEKGRDLPWRKRVNPYRVLISEIMLQQTQVDRVIEKYGNFLKALPDFKTLASISTAQLLSLWSGLGYNRRALALRALAQQVMTNHKGRLPKTEQELLALPGIGTYTAGAVMAFAFNLPVVFMDTNIRRVYIHEFFHDREGIHDNELAPLVEQTLDRDEPSRWYNALMDYGSVLKRDQVNPNRRSAHYTRQSPFENSNRQVRGAIIKALVKHGPLSPTQIASRTELPSVRLKTCLAQLEQEGFVQKQGRQYRL